MLENPWSAVGNPTSILGPSGSSFGPSCLAPIGIHHLLLSNLTTAAEYVIVSVIIIIIIIILSNIVRVYLHILLLQLSVSTADYFSGLYSEC